MNPSYLPLPILTSFQQTGAARPLGRGAGLLAGRDGWRGDARICDGLELVGPAGVRPSPPPAEPAAGKREPQASGSYDAIRVYLWLGVTDPATPGMSATMRSLAGMAGYLRTAMIPPLEVDAQGKVIKADAPVGFSAAVLPYLQREGMAAQAKAQQERVSALVDSTTGLYGSGGLYYDQNLVLVFHRFCGTPVQIRTRTEC